MPPRMSEGPDGCLDEDVFLYAGMAPPLGLAGDPWAAGLPGSPPGGEPIRPAVPLPRLGNRETGPLPATATRVRVGPIRVFVAGPYTQPDPCVNTHAAIRAADELLARGFIPFVPHLSHFWHTMSPKDLAVWLAYDLVWLECCHALLRLAGPSAGADAEVERALELGIPVYESTEDLERHFRVPGRDV